MNWIRLYEEFDSNNKDVRVRIKERLDELDELFDIPHHTDVLNNILQDFSDKTDMSFYQDDFLMDLSIDLHYKKARNRRFSIGYTFLKEILNSGYIYSYYLNDLDSFLDEKLKYAVNIHLNFKSNAISCVFKDISDSKDDLEKTIGHLNKLGYVVIIKTYSSYIEGDYKSVDDMFKHFDEYLDEWGVDESDFFGNIELSFKINKIIDGEEFRDKLDLSGVPDKYIDDFKKFLSNHSVTIKMRNDLIEMLKK